MSPTKEKVSAEDLATTGIPAGHPKAGYVRPDLSEHVGTGTIPDSEKEWHEKRNDAQQEDAEAVLDAEKQAAEEEQKAAEEAASADEPKKPASKPAPVPSSSS